MTSIDCSSQSTSINFLKCIGCSKESADHLFLNCLHSICASCGETVKTTSDNNATPLYTCSKCHVHSNKLIKNVLLGSLSDDNSNQLCSWCLEAGDKIASTGHCVDCSLWLCSECTRGHNRMPAFRAHKLETKQVNKVNDDLMCSVHPKETLELFCETCGVLTCRDCQLSVHKEHGHQWIGEKAADLQNQIEESMQLLSGRKESIEDELIRVQSAGETLQSNMNEIKKTLNDMKVRMISEIEVWHNEQNEYLSGKVSQRSKDIESLESSLKNIKSELNYLEKFSRQLFIGRDSASVIHLTPQVLARLQDILSQAGKEAEHPWLSQISQLSWVQCSQDPSQLLKKTGYLRCAEYDVATKLTNNLEDDANNSTYNDDKDDASTNNDGVSSSMATPHFLLNPNPAYCCMCWDDGLLIFCSGCERVYHTVCHLPALEAPPRSTWYCSLCMDREKLVLHKPAEPLTGRTLKTCFFILLSLMSDANCVEFSVAPDPDLVSPATGETYLDMIEKPLDLGTLRQRLDAEEYASIDEVMDDIQLVFDNCFTFYGDSDTTIKKLAKEMEGKFHRLMEEFLVYKTF